MCISAYASSNSFLVNLISAICLIFYGNSNLKTYNLIFGLFAIYTSLMQVVDFGIWTDLRCKIGTNKIASLLGPILVFLQPIMIFVIAYCVLNKTTIDSTKNRNQIDSTKNKTNTINIKQKIFNMFDISTSKFNLSKAINLFYVIGLGFFLYTYYTNTHTDINCTKVIDGSIKWGWLANKKLSYYNIVIMLYISILFINFVSINPTSTYIYFVILVYGILLLISFTWKKTHLGEAYCYISNAVPLLLLVGQKIFRKYLK
jgi:hypothetical protein